MRVDEDLLTRIGGSRDVLVEAVLNEMRQRGAADIQELGLAQLTAWLVQVKVALKDNNEIPDPPFLPVLAVYVLAVNHGEGGYSAHHYYGRLHSILREPSHRIGSLEPSLRLWHALAMWSSELLGGRSGVFSCSIVGGQEYVGIPRRQVLLASRELPALKEALLANGILPGSSFSDQRLLLAAKKAPGLLSRTKRLLECWPDATAQELVSEIREEVEGWEHIEVERIRTAYGSALPLRLALEYSRGSIRSLVLEVDVVEGITDADRVVVPDGVADTSLPPGRLLPVSANVARLYDAVGTTPWSHGGNILAPIKLRVEDTGFVLLRPAKGYVVFGKGRPGLLEERGSADLAAGNSYLLVAPRPLSAGETPSFVSRWSGDWKHSAVRAGMQERVFITEGLDVRATNPRIEVRGGIPSSPGSSAYLPFALPTIEVPASATPGRKPPEVDVQYFDERGQSMGAKALAEPFDDTLGLLDDGNARLYQIPSPPHQAGSCVIGLRTAEPLVPERRIFVDSHPDVPEGAELPLRDVFGEKTDNIEHSAFRGLEVLSTVSGEMPETPIGRPCAWVSPPTTDRAGLNVMHLLRSRGEIRWNIARQWMPLCSPGNEGSTPIDPNRLAFEVSMLHALGVLELREGSDVGWDALVALPPSVIVLKQRANLGFDRRGFKSGLVALLVGCWLESEIESLRRAGRRYSVDMRELSQHRRLQLSPHSRFLVAEGEHEISRIERSLAEVRAARSRARRGAALPLGQVNSPSEPLALRLARAVAPIRELARSSKWIPGGLSDVWLTRYFDPRSLSVTPNAPADDARFVLAECRHRERAGWRFFLLDRAEGRRLQVTDRQLARWFVRVEALPSAPLPVSGDELVLPWELRLPRVLERSIVLCSGQAPSLKRYSSMRSPLHSSHTSRLFGIPPPPSTVVGWFRSHSSCSGNFICYHNAYGSPAWPTKTPLPAIGAMAYPLSGVGLEE